MALHIDLDTVSAAALGDAAALRSVVESLSRPLYNLSLRMLASHHDAEEATQEALLRIVTHLGNFKGESKFTTWAWTVATRVVFEYRKQRVRAPIPIDGFAEDLLDGLDEGAAPDAYDAVLLQQVKLGCGRAMLLCLDDDLRVAYTLGEILEVPGPEAAEILGLSPAAYRKRVSRARQTVNANLQKVCGVANDQAACRCEKRVKPARRLGRLDDRDADGALDVVELKRRVGAIEALCRAEPFYRSDPMANPEVGLLARVHEALGLA